jgi:hypothetical protein
MSDYNTTIKHTPSLAKAEMRRHKIIEFIHENPNCTKTQVIANIKGSSLVTTHKILKDLENRGIVIVQKPNPQTNYLIINDQNDFNRIEKELSLIEICILRMVDNYKICIREQHEERKKSKDLEDLRVFIHTFGELIDFFLHTLLLQINNEVKFEPDRRTLYRKIISLMVINDQFIMYHDLHMTDLLLQEMKDKMNSKSFITNIRSKRVKLSAMESFILLAEDFRNKYLNVQDFSNQLTMMVEGNKNNF